MKIILIVVLVILIGNCNCNDLRRYLVPKSQMSNPDTTNSGASDSPSNGPGVKIQTIVTTACSPCQGKCQINDPQTCACKTNISCLYQN